MRITEIMTLQEKHTEINTAMKKNLSQRDAEIKTLQEKLAEAQNYKKANQKALQLYRTQEMFEREMAEEKSVNDKIKSMEMEFKLIMEKHHVISCPEESEEKVQDLVVCIY